LFASGLSDSTRLDRASGSRARCRVKVLISGQHMPFANAGLRGEVHLLLMSAQLRKQRC
jgi:hypothetical protein